MRVVFAHDHIFFKDIKSNLIYSSGKLPYKAWERYLNFFDDLIVVSRMEEVFDENHINRMSLSSGKNVTFEPVESLSSPKNLVKKPSHVEETIERVLSQSDALIARLPSEIGAFSIKIAKRLGIPWAVEFVGDPWESLWHYGNLKGKLYAPFQTYKIKKIMKDSKYAIYVTKNSLQLKYPSNGVVSYASNVEIDDTSVEFYSERLKKISRKKPNDRFVIGLIGSLNASYKGIDTALYSMKVLKEKKVDFEFRILGSGNSSKWKKLICKLGLEDVVTFSGIVPKEEVAGWLDEIDIYIQPSLTEGLPRALIEAMSRGCPSIGSTAGGIPELLTDECLHSPKDINRLSLLIFEAINNNNWRKEQSINNFNKAKEYTNTYLSKTRNKFWSKFYNYVLEYNKEKIK